MEKDDKIDVREFMQLASDEWRRSGTSNKAILWVVIGASSIFTLLTAIVAVIALFVALKANDQIANLKDTVYEQRAWVQDGIIDSKRAYDNARKTLSRNRKKDSQ